MNQSRYEPKGHKVSPLSRQAIRKRSQVVLDTMRNILDSKGPFLDIVLALETMAEKGFIELRLFEPHLLEGKAAELIPDYGNDLHAIHISSDVYDRACECDSFGRFTIAHELGHLFLHASQKVTYSRSNADLRHAAFEDSEWQANTFAAELLVDYRVVIEQQLSSVEIQEIFGVSRKTANIQIESLKQEGLI